MNDIVILANTLTHAESLLHRLKQAAEGIRFYANASKTEYICFNQEEYISLKDGPLKLADKFTFLGSSDSSTKSEINMHLEKVWTASDRLSIIWKSDRSDKM